MDLREFDNFWEERHPGQMYNEWKFFMEHIEVYFQNRKIKNPIVVELGIRKNNQKRFYEKYLDARYIGIDHSNEFSIPDILGNTHDEETLKKLKKLLDGKLINLLFIDANHGYQCVKKDYEMYSPLVQNIVAFHDIMTKRLDVKKFWGELIEKERRYTFVSIYKYVKRADRYGIGVIIKE